MPEDIVVIGAGGFGRETLDVIEAINASASEPVWRIVGVFDDAPTEVQRERLGARQIALLGTVDNFRPMVKDCRYVVGIGEPATRARLIGMIGGWGGRAATLVHPGATIGSQVTIGLGSVVCGGTQLSTNVRLGAHVHVNPGAVIGHDAVLEDLVSINPGAIISGEVRIGRETMIGAGAVVLQNLEVGGGALVAASACVTKQVPRRALAKGVPARMTARSTAVRA